MQDTSGMAPPKHAMPIDVRRDSYSPNTIPSPRKSSSRSNQSSELRRIALKAHWRKSVAQQRASPGSQQKSILEDDLDSYRWSRKLSNTPHTELPDVHSDLQGSVINVGNASESWDSSPIETPLSTGDLLGGGFNSHPKGTGRTRSVVQECTTRDITRREQFHQDTTTRLNKVSEDLKRGQALLEIGQAVGHAILMYYQGRGSEMIALLTKATCSAQYLGDQGLAARAQLWKAMILHDHGKTDNIAMLLGDILDLVVKWGDDADNFQLRKMLSQYAQEVWQYLQRHSELDRKINEQDRMDFDSDEAEVAYRTWVGKLLSGLSMKYVSEEWPGPDEALAASRMQLTGTQERPRTMGRTSQLEAENKVLKSMNERLMSDYWRYKSERALFVDGNLSSARTTDGSWPVPGQGSRTQTAQSFKGQQDPATPGQVTALMNDMIHGQTALALPPTYEDPGLNLEHTQTRSFHSRLNKWLDNTHARDSMGSFRQSGLRESWGTPQSARRLYDLRNSKDSGIWTQASWDLPGTPSMMPRQLEVRNRSTSGRHARSMSYVRERRPSGRLSKSSNSKSTRKSLWKKPFRLVVKQEESCERGAEHRRYSKLSSISPPVSRDTSPFAHRLHPATSAERTPFVYVDKRAEYSPMSGELVDNMNLSPMLNAMLQRLGFPEDVHQDAIVHSHGEEKSETSQSQSPDEASSKQHDRESLHDNFDSVFTNDPEGVRPPLSCTATRDHSRKSSTSSSPIMALDLEELPTTDTLSPTELTKKFPHFNEHQEQRRRSLSRLHDSSMASTSYDAERQRARKGFDSAILSDEPDQSMNDTASTSSWMSSSRSASDTMTRTSSDKYPVSENVRTQSGSGSDLHVVKSKRRSASLKSSALGNDGSDIRSDPVPLTPLPKSPVSAAATTPEKASGTGANAVLDSSKAMSPAAPEFVTLGEVLALVHVHGNIRYTTTKDSPSNAMEKSSTADNFAVVEASERGNSHDSREASHATQSTGSRLNRTLKPLDTEKAAGMPHHRHISKPNIPSPLRRSSRVSESSEEGSSDLYGGSPQQYDVQEVTEEATKADNTAEPLATTSTPHTFQDAFSDDEWRRLSARYGLDNMNMAKIKGKHRRQSQRNASEKDLIDLREFKHNVDGNHKPQLQLFSATEDPVSPDVTEALPHNDMLELLSTSGKGKFAGNQPMQKELRNDRAARLTRAKNKRSVVHTQERSRERGRSPSSIKLNATPSSVHGSDDLPIAQQAEGQVEADFEKSDSLSSHDYHRSTERHMSIYEKIANDYGELTPTSPRKPAVQTLGRDKRYDDGRDELDIPRYGGYDHHLSMESSVALRDLGHQKKKVDLPMFDLKNRQPQLGEQYFLPRGTAFPESLHHQGISAVSKHDSQELEIPRYKPRYELDSPVSPRSNPITRSTPIIASHPQPQPPLRRETLARSTDEVTKSLRSKENRPRPTIQAPPSPEPEELTYDDIRTRHLPPPRESVWERERAAFDVESSNATVLQDENVEITKKPRVWLPGQTLEGLNEHNQRENNGRGKSSSGSPTTDVATNF